jgi:uncharacterized protein (TIGR03435 family)
MQWLLTVVAAGALLAQEQPAFEAASVKLNTSGDGGMSMRTTASQVEWGDTSLRILVQTAYRLHDYAYSGPAWLDSVDYDIIAKLPADRRFDGYPEMLQTLLAERFKLAVHRETKEMIGLALVADKKGLRIKPVEPGPSMTSTNGNFVRASKVSMTQFADLLANTQNRPVKDLTGLPGVYDIDIKWTADMPSSADPGDLPGSIYAAVHELGLHLQVQKIPVEILVVDHAERVPTGN